MSDERAEFEEWLGTETCPVHFDESANKNAWYGWQASARATRERIANRIRAQQGGFYGSFNWLADAVEKGEIG